MNDSAVRYYSCFKDKPMDLNSEYFFLWFFILYENNENFSIYNIVYKNQSIKKLTILS